MKIKGLLKNRWFVLISLLVLLILSGIFYYYKTRAIVTINGREFRVSVARTEGQRAKGLMYRNKMNENAGMLFVFSVSDIYTIWMKNTYIPLDVIWISDNHIVDMARLDAQSKDKIPQYTSAQKANYVLELNAGITQKYNIKIGDLVDIKH
jgi:hypothetical protein